MFPPEESCSLENASPSGSMKQSVCEGREGVGDPPALQGLPGLWPVLLRPLKNPAPPLSFSLSILQVSTSCLSPWLPMVFLHRLAALCSQADSSPGAVSQQLARCLEAQPP